MQLETVGSVAMSAVLVKRFGKVDDLNGLEWAFLFNVRRRVQRDIHLDTNTTTDAESLRDEGHL